jgi:hypothetical protein
VTNHPRRAGRRKHQRRAALGWTDLTSYVAGVRLDGLRTWNTGYRIHVNHPRQQQLKGPM